MFDKYTPVQLPIIQKAKVGRNELCPCGSGKKYKKCCAIIQIGGRAQLSDDERELFYEIWHKLLDFVNRKCNIINMYIDQICLNYHDDLQLCKIRGKLWEEPNLIDAFLKEVRSLSADECAILQSWRTGFIKSEFVLMGYMSKYSVLMSIQSGKPCKLYGVKGINSSIAETMHQQLPVMLETVLLPFKDKIIYDSFMITDNIEFGGEVKNMFMKEYAKAERKFGIITQLTP